MEQQTNPSVITQLGSGPLSPVQRIKPIVKPKSASEGSGGNCSRAKYCEIVEVFYGHRNLPELEKIIKKNLVDSYSSAVFICTHKSYIIILE